MSGKTYLRKATSADIRLKKARKVVAVAHKEREQLLDKALIFTTTVSDAMRIYETTDRKELKTLSWLKAVLLLGSTRSEVENLLLIIACKYSPTQKEREVAEHLRVKMKAILECATAEQLYHLYQVGDYSDQQLAKRRLEEVFKNVQDLSELQQLHDKYSGVSGFWDSWNYKRTHERLAGSPE